jgi:hypothetical protein
MSYIHFNIVLAFMCNIPDRLFPSGFSTNVLYAFRTSPIILKRDYLILFPFYVTKMSCRHRVCLVAHSGLVVSVLVIGPKVRGFKHSQRGDIFNADKNS